MGRQHKQAFLVSQNISDGLSFRLTINVATITFIGAVGDVLTAKKCPAVR
jgi:hypothetical protein